MYLIEARHVRKDFVTKRNIFGKPVRTITPVLDVSLGILRALGGLRVVSPSSVSVNASCARGPDDLHVGSLAATKRGKWRH